MMPIIPAYSCDAEDGPMADAKAAQRTDEMFVIHGDNNIMMVIYGDVVFA